MNFEPLIWLRGDAVIRNGPNIVGAVFITVLDR